MQPALVALAAAASLQLTGYPVLAHVAGVPVEAPAAGQAWGSCPSGAEVVDAAGMVRAKQAVLAVLPLLAKRTQPPLMLRGARVTHVLRTRLNGSILPARRSCWGRPFLRSILVMVFLPAERATPSLSGNPWFYVARTPYAWVIWDAPH